MLRPAEPKVPIEPVGVRSPPTCSGPIRIPTSAIRSSGTPDRVASWRAPLTSIKPSIQRMSMLLKFRSCLGDLAGCFVLAATRIDLVRVTGAGSALAALEWVSTGGFDGDRASNVTEVRMDLARFELEADPGPPHCRQHAAGRSTSPAGALWRSSGSPTRTPMSSPWVRWTWPRRIGTHSANAGPRCSGSRVRSALPATVLVSRPLPRMGRRRHLRRLHRRTDRRRCGGRVERHGDRLRCASSPSPPTASAAGTVAPSEPAADHRPPAPPLPHPLQNTLREPRLAIPRRRVHERR